MNLKQLQSCSINIQQQLKIEAALEITNKTTIIINEIRQLYEKENSAFYYRIVCVCFRLQRNR